MKKYLLIALLIIFIREANAQQVLGIDVSHYQGTIDWQQVYAAGKVFAYAKCAEGVNGADDATFSSNMTNGNNAGVKMGAYFVATPLNHTALDEANHFLSLANVNGYIGTNHLPPALDLEPSYVDAMTLSDLSSWVQIWMTTVQNATGVAPIIYTTHGEAQNRLSSSLNGYKLWIANYGNTGPTNPLTPPTNLGEWNTWAFNQYAGGNYPQSVPGISGGADLDVFNGDITAFYDLINAACSAPSAPTPTLGSTSGCPGTAVNTAPQLSWQSNGGSSFHVSVSQYPYGDDNLVIGSPICLPSSSTTFQTSGLLPGMLYRWNMYAFGGANCSDCPSTVSATNYFNIPPVITTNGNKVCNGQNIFLSTTAQTPGAGATINYVWYKDGVVFQQGSTLTSINVTAQGTYHLVIQYSGSTYCSGTAATDASNSIVITDASPAIPVLTGNSNICQGQLASVAVTNNCSCSYLWSDGETAFGQISVKPSTTTSYTVKVTNSCGASSTSSPFTVTVSPYVVLNPGPISGNNLVNYDESYHYSIAPVQGALKYNWETVPGNGANIDSLTTNPFINIKWSNTGAPYDVVYVWAINQCGAGSSSHEIVYFTGTLPPTISIAANQKDTICAGTPIIFTASITNGGSAPAYQWKKNNKAVGTNSATYKDNLLKTGDSVVCVLTVSGQTYNSNVIKFTVNATVMPTVAITDSVGAATGVTAICTGTKVKFKATATGSGTTPVYQWKKNGIKVGTNSATYTDSLLKTGDSLLVVVKSNAQCSMPDSATSKAIKFTVNQIVKPAVTITDTVATKANVDTVCIGTKVKFKATATGGGTTPAYQWKKNGLKVGTNSAIYTDSLLKNGDLVLVVVTSNAACTVPDSATSKAIKFIVQSSIPAEPSAISGPISVKAGQTCGFKVTHVAGVNYIWAVPTGDTIKTGQGTDSVTVKWGGPAGAITVKANNACGTSATVKSNISVTVGFEDPRQVAENAELQVLLYPNPARDAANLRLSGFTGGIIITVTDMAGKVVWRQDKLTNGTYTVPLSNLASGMYIVTIKDRNSIRSLKLEKAK